MESLKTGTTTVGIVCTDGIILAADKRATAGNLIVDKKAQKIHIINDSLALTTAGSVSEIQLLVKLIRAELDLKGFQTGRKPSVEESCNLLSGMVYASIRRMSMLPGVAHFVVGGRDESGLYLYDVFPDGSLTLIDEYVASGSGSVFAYGLLENVYKKDLTVEKGVEIAVKAVNTALQRDSASGNGIDAIKITKDGIEYVVQKKLEMKA